MSKLLLKRGTTAQVQEYEASIGEPVLDTSTNQLYIGGVRVAAPTNTMGVTLAATETAAAARTALAAAPLASPALTGTPTVPTAETDTATTQIASTAFVHAAATIEANKVVASSLVALDAYHKSNIVGTVSQTSGTPTGAIVEQGSTSTGQYVRFADGTQICYGEVTSSAVATSTTATATWTYPKAFSAAPIVQMAFRGREPHMVSGGCTSVGVASAVLTNLNKATTAQDIIMMLVATGRWY